MEYLTWELVYNNGGYHKDILPTGYKISGIITEDTAYNRMPVGGTYTMAFFRHTVLNAIHSGEPNQFSLRLLYKQP